MPDDDLLTRAAIFRDERLLVLLGEGSHALPSARVASGEDPARALENAVRDQTGLQIYVVAPVHTEHIHTEGRDVVARTYYCEWVEGEMRSVDHHSETPYEWVTLDDIEDRGWSGIAHYLAAFDRYELLSEGS